MLLRHRPDGSGAWENMLVGKFGEMALFTQQLWRRPDGVAVVVVSFGGGKEIWEKKKEGKLEVALEPDIQGLELIDVVLHSSGTKTYRMGERYDRWFSDCFGYQVSPLFSRVFAIHISFLFSCQANKILSEPYPNYGGIGGSCLPRTASTSGARELGS